MSVKEFLHQGYELDKQIEQSFKRIAMLREHAGDATSRATALRLGGTSNRSHMEDCIAKVVDLEREIDISLNKLADIRKTITYAIDQVVGADHRLLLDMRYLGYFKWDDIAKRFHCSEEHIYHLHGKALQEVKICTVMHV